MHYLKEIVAKQLLLVGHKADPFIPNKFISDVGSIDLNFKGKAKLIVYKVGSKEPVIEDIVSYQYMLSILNHFIASGVGKCPR